MIGPFLSILNALKTSKN